MGKLIGQNMGERSPTGEWTDKNTVFFDEGCQCLGYMLLRNSAGVHLGPRPAQTTFGGLYVWRQYLQHELCPNILRSRSLKKIQEEIPILEHVSLTWKASALVCSRHESPLTVTLMALGNEFSSL